MPSSSRVGALAVSRSAELVTSQVKACAVQSSGLGPFTLDVPPPWELERDARGLTFNVLSSCVGWTELVEGVPVLKSHQCATISDAWPASYDQAPETTPHRPGQGDTDNSQGSRPTRANDQLDWLGLGFTTWCVSTSRIHPSVNQEGNPAPWPLTSSGLSCLFGL